MSSEVVGERGGDSVDRGYPKWTSDHRAVLSQLKVTPVPIPTTVALSSRMLTVGDDVTVSYRMPTGGDGATVKLTGPSTASYDVTRRVGHRHGAHHPAVSRRLPGRPRRRGRAVVATNDLYVRPKDGQGRRSPPTPPTYAVGDPITVHWADGPANRWDWIGVYRAGAADPKKDDYLIWGYTGGHDAGALPPTHRGRARPRPRAPGQALATTAGSVRRPLPAHRPVHQRGVDHLHRAVSLVDQTKASPNAAHVDHRARRRRPPCPAADPTVSRRPRRPCPRDRRRRRSRS